MSFIFLPSYSKEVQNNVDQSEVSVQKKKPNKKNRNSEKKVETSNDGSTELTSKNYKKDENSFDMGYEGKIPDISKHFRLYQTEETEPEYEVNEDFNDPYKVKPAPRDNPAFINIILKEDKTSQFINELNELIFIIEKIQQTVEDNASLQIFIARAYNFGKYVEFFRSKYENKPESSFASYKSVMELNNEVQALAALRREKEIYSPYVISASNGNIFSDNNIEQQNEYLLDNIRRTLIILKEAK